MTDKPQWTEGEWRFDDDAIYSGNSIVADFVMWPANGALMARSKDLYRELEDAADRLEELAGDNIIPESVQGALRRRAARYRRTLAKARGEE